MAQLPNIKEIQPWVEFTGNNTGNPAPVSYANYSLGGWMGVLAAAARAANPAIAKTLRGSTPWVTATVYTAPVVVSSNGGLYAVVGAGGTSGATAPIGAGQVSDGTLNWEYLGPQEAPALSVSATHNAGLTHTYKFNSNILAPRTGFVRFGGGTPVAQPAQGTGVTIWNETVTVALGNLGNGANSSYSRFTFGFEGTKCEFQIVAFAAGVKASIKVDGAYIDGQFSSSTNGFWFITLDFTGIGRGTHIIEVETSQVYGVGQIATEATGTFFYPSLDQDWGVVAIGDSQTQSVGDTTGTSWKNMWVRTGLRLGWPDVMPSGVGGTGFVAAANGNPAYQGRILSELNRYAAWRDIGAICLQASSNDNGVASGTLQTAVMQTIQLVRAQQAYANTPIFVFGCITGGGFTVAQGQTIETAVQAGVNQLLAVGYGALSFIPVAGQIFGTGFEGGTNGSGNSDFDTGPDGIHMTAAGHDFWSQNQVSQLRAIIASNQ